MIPMSTTIKPMLTTTRAMLGPEANEVDEEETDQGAPDHLY
jgi:hypothetical protein